jgi:hypothetical protein
MDFIQRFLAPFKFYLCLLFVGPGGVVEAEGFVITRPENAKFSDAEIRHKSEDLRNLAEALKMSGFHSCSR